MATKAYLTPARPPMVRMRPVLRLTPKQHECVRKILESGLYGRTEAEVVERLISRSIVELLKNGVLVI